MLIIDCQKSHCFWSLGISLHCRFCLPQWSEWEGGDEFGEATAANLPVVQGKIKGSDCRYPQYCDAIPVTHCITFAYRTASANLVLLTRLLYQAQVHFSTSAAYLPTLPPSPSIQATLQSTFHTVQRSISTINHHCRLSYLCKFFNFRFGSNHCSCFIRLPRHSPF